jgi:hypothetical protein
LSDLGGHYIAVLLFPEITLVLYRPKPVVRQAQLPFPAQQLWLFELVQTA